MERCKGANLNLRRNFDEVSTDTGLLQGPWTFKHLTMWINSKLGLAFVGTKADSPRACIWVSKKINAIRDLVTVAMIILKKIYNLT